MTDLPPYAGPRFKLILGKFPILRVEAPLLGVKQFSILIHNVRVVIPAPHDADVHEGDLITLYTEVAVNVPPTSTQ